MDLYHIQTELTRQQLDGWLLYDFRGNNSVLAGLLPAKRHLTRRVYLLIPRQGEPKFLAHHMEKAQWSGTGFDVQTYGTWPTFQQGLIDLLKGCKRVAMEYSPMNALPVVSMVDAGTVELVRSLGVEVVSSADLVQSTVAVWSESALKNHRDACRKVETVKDAAFDLIRQKLGEITEWDVASFIMQGFEAAGLESHEAPIVGVNEHSGNPHFAVSQTNPSLIKAGDWVLIDLWSRMPGNENIHCDITWTGYCGSTVPEKHQKLFDIVKATRDAALHLAQDAWKQKQRLEGWELDDAGRAVMKREGYADFFTHRIGHSLSSGPAVHGMGMNLDNFETHDTRAMLPGIGFTIEPGIYLPELGVRNEIDVYVDPIQGPTVTSCSQEQVMLI